MSFVGLTNPDNFEPGDFVTIESNVEWMGHIIAAGSFGRIAEVKGEYLLIERNAFGLTATIKASLCKVVVYKKGLENEGGKSF